MTIRAMQTLISGETRRPDLTIDNARFLGITSNTLEQTLLRTAGGSQTLAQLRANERGPAPVDVE